MPEIRSRQYEKMGAIQHPLSMISKFCLASLRQKFGGFKMDNEKKFYLRVGQNVEEVSEEIYKEYYKMRRRERYLEERDLAHGQFLYSQFDNVYEDILGEELFKDSTKEDVCDSVVTKVMIEKLRKSLKLLNDEELELIIDLFYKEKSQRQLSREIGIPLMTINSRKDCILKKLKKHLEN